MPSIFDAIAPRYELINHLLTLGLDLPWRRRAARLAAEAGGLRWLDVCAGTGEMAWELRLAGGLSPQLLALDASLPMLQAGAARCAAANVTRLAAAVTALPIPDATIDLVTMSFAARNVSLRPRGLEAALREFHRVLAPGGRFVNLETSQPRNRLVRWVLRSYASLALEKLGRLFSGTRSYVYLAGTIPTFPGAEALAATMLDAGFNEATFRRLTFGVVAIHVAVK